MRPILLLAALAVAAVPLAAQQQTGTVIRSGGTFAPVPDPTFEVPRDLTYRVAWDINKGSDAPDKANDAFGLPARLLNQSVAAGVPLSNIQMAIVVHGSAGEELLSHAEYRKRKGSDNPNAALLKELADAGVRIIICGQTVANKKMPRDQLLPFVLVAPSAAWAHAVLQAQGFKENPF